MKISQIKVGPQTVSASSENTNNIKDYKRLIKKILALSSLSYLISPFRSKRILLKILWTIFLTGLLFGSIYYVLTEILAYLQYDIVTSIYEIKEQEPDFPTISFCETRDRNNFENIKIIYFWFQNENLINEWQNHFQSYTDTRYGICFRFNSGFNWSNQSIPIKKSLRPGLDDGFFLNYYFNTTFDSSSPIIYIHNKTERPETIFRKGLYFSAGSLNYIRIKRTHDLKLE